MTELRTKIIKIRATENEYLCIQENCGSKKLAVWAREQCLKNTELASPVTSENDGFKKSLLYEISKIGNNINQISRKLNSNNVSDFELIAFQSQLMNISEYLKKIYEVSIR